MIHRTLYAAYTLRGLVPAKPQTPQRFIWKWFDQL